MVSVERVQHSGHLVLSELVTDGDDEWFESVQYYDYGVAEARRLFRDHLREKGLTPVP